MQRRATIETLTMLAATAALLSAAEPPRSVPAPAVVSNTVANASSQVATTERGFLDRLVRFFSPTIRRLDAERAQMEQELESLPTVPRTMSSEGLGYHSAISELAPTVSKWVQVDLGEPLRFDMVALVPAHATSGGASDTGYGFPVRFRVDIGDDPAFVDFETIGDYTEELFPNPGDYPVLIHTPAQRARYVRVTALQLQLDTAYRFALGELLVIAGERNIAAGRSVTARDAYESPPNWGKALLTDGISILGPPQSLTPSATDGFRSLDRRAERWVLVDLGASVPVDEIRLHPARASNLPARRGYGFPARFRVELADDPGFEGASVVFDATGADYLNPGENPVTINTQGRFARLVRIFVTKPWIRRGGEQVFALAELEVFSRGRNVARGAAVEASDSDETERWGKAALVDGANSTAMLSPLRPWLRSLAQRPAVEAQIRDLDQRRAQQADRVLYLLSSWSLAGMTSAVVTVGFLQWRHRRQRHREVVRLRERIARDLHDEIGSSLGSISLLSSMAQDPSLSREELLRELESIQQIAESSVDSMRAIVSFIRPDLDSEAPLPARLREVAQRMLAGREVEFHCAENFPSDKLPLEFRFHLLLIVKEALHNILKHSGAKKVLIAIEASARELKLRIRDDGRGFDEARITPGSGLRNLRQRAERIGGELTIRSAAGSGTEILLSAPLS